MLSRITFAQFGEWMVYSNLEPFGEERADLRAGIIASTVANASGSTKKTFKPSDFMPDFGKESKPRRSSKDMQMMLRASFAGAKAKAQGRTRPPKKRPEDE